MTIYWTPKIDQNLENFTSVRDFVKLYSTWTSLEKNNSSTTRSWMSFLMKCMCSLVFVALMLNWIFGKLDGTMIIIPYGFRMLSLESKHWKDMSKPQGFLTCINQCSILFFLWRKINSLLFLTGPSERCWTKDEKITCIRLSINRVFSAIWINERNQ